MPRQPEPQSFEVAGERYDRSKDVKSLISSAASAYSSPDPSYGFKVSFVGDKLVIKFHCYETSLDERIKLDNLLISAKDAISQYVKYLKKNVKENGGKTLSLKELKDKRNYGIEKVSLNNRWYLKYTQTYDLDGLTSYPED